MEGENFSEQELKLIAEMKAANARYTGGYTGWNLGNASSSTVLNSLYPAMPVKALAETDIKAVS